VQRLLDGEFLLSDGAWGTLLQAQGLQPGECPELWCVERRAAVLAVAKSYVQAGSDLIETNSFGGTRFKLEFFGLGGRTAEINRAAAAISREAAGPARPVIASVGPTGRMLLMGDVTESQLYEAFREQLTALESGGADACCIETFSDIEEARIAIRAAKEATRLDVICTFTFQQAVDGTYRTMMGVSPEEAGRAAAEAGADVIGANCGQGMAQMVPIVQAMQAAVPAKPIMVQANAGMPKTVDGKDVFPESPEVMARHVAPVVAAGARIVGGCCGTTPAHIAAMGAVLRGLAKQRVDQPRR
jgi:5-methyltetrahydrofolate--homocysteine methyltransferase